MIQREEYLNWLIKLKDKHIIKVITGIRRCGKSTIFRLYQEYLLKNNISEKQIIDLNFDDNKNRDLLEQNKLYDYIISKAVSDKKTYIFLDEVQNVKDFEKCVNSLHLNENFDIYLTGSNSYMLSGELATFLTGRYMQIHMLPLSFKEFKSTASESNEEIVYNNYISDGGFPYLINLNDFVLKNNYLDGIYNTVLIKDIITRKQIKDVLILDSVVRFLFDNIGCLVSTKKISDTLNSSGRKNSINTIESYVSALIDSYIIYKVNRYDIKGKQHLKTLEKYYVCDLGLRNYLLGNKEGMDLGHILENIIFLELKRRGHKIYVGKTENSEIDFVIEDNREIKYIQVALTVRDKNTLNRELAPLNSIEDHHPKYLITLDFDTNNHSGIKQINALDYLMGRVDI
ncbi:MAG TPA: ATP-binding protein [Clostridium sp.]|nr:ATP-binding protein [Clostridium sp.]